MYGEQRKLDLCFQSKSQSGVVAAELTARPCDPSSIRFLAVHHTWRLERLAPCRTE